MRTGAVPLLACSLLLLPAQAAKLGTRKHPRPIQQNPAEPYDNSGGTFDPTDYVSPPKARNRIVVDSQLGFPLEVQFYLASQKDHIWRRVVGSNELRLPKGKWLVAIGAGSAAFPHFEFGPYEVKCAGNSGKKLYWTMVR